MSGVSYECSRGRATDAIGDGLFPSLGRVLLCDAFPFARAPHAVPFDSPFHSTAARAPHSVTARDTLGRRLEFVS